MPGLAIDTIASRARWHVPGGGTPPPAATIPANWDVLFYGDSRTADGIGSSASLTTGYVPATQNLGAAGWIGPVSGGRLRAGRYANFAIGASTTAQGAAIPRLDANGVASTGRWDRPSSSTDYASNKGADYAAAHPAGIVMLLYGTNDAGGIPVTTEANLVAIMNAIGSGKLILLCNELPRGIDDAGAVAQAYGTPAGAYTLSRELLKYDYASGDAKARSNVIAINGYDEFLDVASGASYYNKRGYLRDGLHFTPYGARRLAQIAVDRLASVYGAAWTALPMQATLPAVNGLTTPSATQPFIHTNPILTPGTNGTVLGTWGGAPAASTIPQGWTISTSGTGSGITCVCDKTSYTDPDGYPVLQLVFSGTLANATSFTAQLYQLLSGAALTTALAGGYVAITDKFRATANVKVAAESAYLAATELQAYPLSATATRQQKARANMGSLGSAGLLLNNHLDACGDADWFRLTTELLDCQDPNLVAISQNMDAFSQIITQLNIFFRNDSGSSKSIGATVHVSRMGMWRASA